MYVPNNNTSIHEAKEATETREVQQTVTIDNVVFDWTHCNRVISKRPQV